MEKAVDKETAKENFRSSRLSWSNQAEHKLRQELNDIALANCRSTLQAFATCAKENNLLVVFKCREQNRAMNECLHQYTNDDEFRRYKEQREQDFLEKL